MLGTAGEVRTNPLETFSYGVLHIDTTELAAQSAEAVEYADCISTER